jgi:hypothetical protein
MASPAHGKSMDREPELPQNWQSDPRLDRAPLFVGWTAALGLLTG